LREFKKLNISSIAVMNSIVPIQSLNSSTSENFKNSKAEAVKKLNVVCAVVSSL